jgi:hypothetical protein
VNPNGQWLIKLWMPSMGHGSSPVKISQALGTAGAPLDGVFNVTNVFFVMPGEWEIRVIVKDGNGNLLDQAALPYRFN